MFHMYVGVRAGGGIGDEIEDPAGDEYEIYRIIFDITFFFFVIVILLAIIQGDPPPGYQASWNLSPQRPQPLSGLVFSGEPAGFSAQSLGASGPGEGGPWTRGKESHLALPPALLRALQPLGVPSAWGALSLGFHQTISL